MAFLWFFRPLLRLYFRHKRLFLLTIAAVVIFAVFFPFQLRKPLSAMSNMISIPLGSARGKATVRNPDIYIPEHEFHFEEVKDNSLSLFGGAQCLLLDLDPFSKVVTTYQKDLGELKCSAPEVTKLEGGVLSVKGTGLQEVTYQAIKPSEDSKANAGFVLGDRMAVVTALVQLTAGWYCL